MEINIIAEAGFNKKKIQQYECGNEKVERVE